MSCEYVPPNKNPIVEIKQGNLKGKVETNYLGGKYYSFLGIPFAEPPVGKLRFKGPKPPSSWTGVRDALTDGNPSHSRHMLTKEFIGSEDCLYLNVFTPELPPLANKTLKPVLFFIHGGAFVEGSNATEFYGGGYIVTQDVVLVATNYRLGALGNIGFKDPKLDTPGNNGLKDCVAALKWVQKNIKVFGGDPNNVTIFGQSAGAAICHYLILSPMGKGLFKRAILQSGCALNVWAISKCQPELLAKALGYTGSDSEADIYEFLLKASADRIAEQQEKVPEMPGYDGGVLTWAPTIEVTGCLTESNFLTKSAMEIIQSGDFNDVPMIIGYNRDEGLICLSSSAPESFRNAIETKNIEDLVPLGFGLQRGSPTSLAVAQSIKNFYYGDKEISKENWKPFVDYTGDLFCGNSVANCVMLQSKISKSPIYMYRFDVDLPFCPIKTYFKISAPGVTHSEELAYLFSSPLAKLDPCDKNASNTIARMSKLWSNFGKTGNPNSITDELLPVEWQPFANGFKLLNIGLDLNMIGSPEAERYQFWENLIKKLTSH